MIKLLSSVLSLIILTGCSTVSADENQEAQKQLKPPANCEQSDVVDAFAAQVPGSKYVPTEWQPSEGTDLYDVYQAGGIACTYGIQVAEVGGTVMWAPNADNLWERKKLEWLELGQKQIDIPGIDEQDAYILKEGSTSADEMHVWGVNLLINNVWIQVNASFLQNIDEATPIIDAAVRSLR